MATQTQQRNENENESRSQQSRAYFQMQLAVRLPFLEFLRPRNSFYENKQDENKSKPAVFLRSYLSRTGPRSVLDKYDPEKSRWYPKEKDLFLEIKRPGIH